MWSDGILTCDNFCLIKRFQQYHKIGLILMVKPSFSKWVLSLFNQNNNSLNWTGGMAQMVEHLPSKGWNPEFNPQMQKKKKISIYIFLCT
jgi:hypothetical protein